MAKNPRNIQKGPVSHQILSDRGIQLERANQLSENSNINNGRMFMVQNKEGNDVPVTIGQRCPVCQMRVRGINHQDGAHHRGVVPTCKR